MQELNQSADQKPIYWIEWGCGHKSIDRVKQCPLKGRKCTPYQLIYITVTAINANVKGDNKKRKKETAKKKDQQQKDKTKSSKSSKYK